MFAIDIHAEDHQFVEQCYQLVLGRPPDSSGLAGWLTELASGAIKRSGIARAMLYSNERLSLAMRPYLDFEPLIEQFYRAWLHPGDTAIDVGAHSGRHSRPLYDVLSGASKGVPAGGGQLFLFEPIPSLALALRSHFKHSIIPVTMFNCAVSDSEGTADFAVALDRPEESSLMERAQYNGATRIQHVAVQLRTVDAIVAHIDALHFVKIDVEGAEMGALRGASKTLSRLRPVVEFESGGRSLGGFGFAANDVFDFFAGHGYVLFDILGTRMARETFATSMLREQVWDYVAAPEESSDSVQAILAW